MGIKANINIGGLSGELYLTVITSTDNKFTGETEFLIRGFESREIMYDAIANDNYPNDESKQISPSFEKHYTMPLIDMNKGKWAQIYDWLKQNHFPSAIDVIE